MNQLIPLFDQNQFYGRVPNRFYVTSQPAKVDSVFLLCGFRFRSSFIHRLLVAEIRQVFRVFKDSLVRIHETKKELKGFRIFQHQAGGTKKMICYHQAVSLFQCHVSVIPIYSCMEHRDLKHFSVAAGLAMAICVFTYTGNMVFAAGSAMAICVFTQVHR